MRKFETVPGEHISQICWEMYEEVCENNIGYYMEFNDIMVLMIPIPENYGKRGDG